MTYQIMHLKTLKKKYQKERFLKQLIALYSSPWAKTRQIKDLTNYYQKVRQNKTHQRFETDKQRILENVRQLFCTGYPESLSGNKQIIQAISLIISGTPNCLEQEIFQALPEPNAHIAYNQALETKVDTVSFIHIILSQVIEEGLVPHFYDIDYIDDIAPIIKSRYINEKGTTYTEYSTRFLEALWVLCGNSLPLTDASLLPNALKQQIGSDHKYTPSRRPLPKESISNSLIPEFLNELVSMNASQDPERFLEICKINFERFNQQVSAPKFEDRDLSIIYGYENDFHLILRTIIRLMNDNRLSKEDPVLIIGPRHVDEVTFFRDYLGLKNTIGMDLFSENDMVVAGDMHNMPFPDNHFQLIYSANTFEYSYNLRLVIREIARVLKRPGFVANINRSNPNILPMPLGRTDVVNLETALNMYYEYPHTVLAQDIGLTADPELYGTFPNYMLRLN